MQGTCNIYLSFRLNEFQKMSDERRKERDPKKILAIAEHVDVNLPDYSSKFKRGCAYDSTLL